MKVYKLSQLKHGYGDISPLTKSIKGIGVGLSSTSICFNVNPDIKARVYACADIKPESLSIVYQTIDKQEYIKLKFNILDIYVFRYLAALINMENLFKFSI